jgi:hypothetical protein
LAIHNTGTDLYDFGVKNLARLRIVTTFLLSVQLAGCIGWGHMFRTKRAIAGDYFLMEGETPNSLYLFVRGDSSSVAGGLRRIGWNHQYIIYAEQNQPVEWNVIAVEGHNQFKINDIQRVQDPRFREIVMSSRSEAWEKAKTQDSD